MTTAFAQRFRAAVDSLTRPRIEVMLDVCVSATIDAPDRRSPSCPSRIRNRERTSTTTTIAATTAKGVLQAARVFARFSAEALRGPAMDE
jgi:hypothetical protein